MIQCEFFQLPGENLLLEQRTSISRSSFERAICWYLASGIQEPSGGVARYYHSDTRRNARVSTEITGYAVSALCYAYQRSGDPAALDAALKAGRFLVGTAWDASLRTFPFELHGESPLAYFFDTGIIVRGLLKLWRVTSERVFLDRAREAGSAMIGDFAHPAGFHPVLELPAKTARPYEPAWSRSPGCYQL